MTISRSRQGVWNGEIDWLLNAAASACGQRGAGSGFLNAMETGSASSGGLPNSDIYSDDQIGWGLRSAGKPKDERGSIALKRKLEQVYWSVSERTQAILWIYYTPKQFHPGVEGTLGDMAGLTLWAAMFADGDTGLNRVLSACGEGKIHLLDKDVKTAISVQRMAHDEWREKRFAASPRLKSFYDRMWK